MTKDIEQKTTQRELLKKADQDFVLAKHDFKPTTDPIYLQISEYVNNGVKSDVESKLLSTYCANGQKEIKAFAEKRLEATRILDGVKKDMMEIEQATIAELLELIKEATIINNTYASDKARKAQELKDKIEKENNQKVEREILKGRIENCLENAMADELSDIKRKMDLSWASLTADNFEDKIKILKVFKPKVSIDKLLTYFNLSVIHIKQDEVDQLIKERMTLGYIEFCKGFESKFEFIKNEFVNKIDLKRNELKTQSDTDRVKLEQQAEDAAVEERIQLKVDQRLKEAALKQVESNTHIQGEMEMQAKMAGIEDVKGRTVWTAYITGKVDWAKIVDLYIEEQGADKLEFLLAWLTKNGRPEIEGVTYESTKKVINRS